MKIRSLLAFVAIALALIAFFSLPGRSPSPVGMVTMCSAAARTKGRATYGNTFHHAIVAWLKTSLQADA